MPYLTQFATSSSKLQSQLQLKSNHHSTTFSLPRFHFHPPSKSSKMQFTTVAILLAAAIGANAAPTDFTKRLDSVPLSIYSGEQCASQAVTTAYIPTDGSCFPTSPIFSGNTNSFYVDPANLTKLPAGCSRKLTLRDCEREKES